MARTEKYAVMIPDFISGLVTFVLALVELLLGLRVILKLFGANADAQFVNWAYETSRGLIEPFVGMFPSPVPEGGFVIEFSALFALIIYALVGFLVLAIVSWVREKTATYSS